MDCLSISKNEIIKIIFHRFAFEILERDMDLLSDDFRKEVTGCLMKKMSLFTQKATFS